jgi:hypothetical protein
MDVYSTELGIRLSFGKRQNFGISGGGVFPSVRHCTLHLQRPLLLKDGITVEKRPVNLACDSDTDEPIFIYPHDVYFISILALMM